MRDDIVDVLMTSGTLAAWHLSREIDSTIRGTSLHILPSASEGYFHHEVALMTDNQWFHGHRVGLYNVHPVFDATPPLTDSL